MSRWLNVVGAGVLLAGTLMLDAPGVATACACGAVVTSDAASRVADEAALVTTDGHAETVIMRLNLQSTAENAALVFPTPTPATVSLTSPSLFDELEQLSAPRVETRRHWTFGGLGMMNDAAPAPTGAPTVVNQVQLGPLEATTLAGGDVNGVQQWLRSHGYTMRPEVVAQLGPYLQQGWAFVAMRLTGAAPLNGRLAPVKMVFASDQLVYPMRMSAAAQNPQRAVIYTLGAHRMQRTDPDAAAQGVDIVYAGSIAGRTRDQTLTDLTGHGAFMTEISVQISDPGTIKSDFVFGPAPNDDPYQQVIYRDQDENLTLIVLTAAFLIDVVIVAVVVLIIVVRGRRKSTAG